MVSAIGQSLLRLELDVDVIGFQEHVEVAGRHCSTWARIFGARGEA
jgi:hypothetical protein